MYNSDLVEMGCNLFRKVLLMGEADYWENKPQVHITHIRWTTIHHPSAMSQGINSTSFWVEFILYTIYIAIKSSLGMTNMTILALKTTEKGSQEQL